MAFIAAAIALYFIIFVPIIAAVYWPYVIGRGVYRTWMRA